MYSTKKEVSRSTALQFSVSLHSLLGMPGGPTEETKQFAFIHPGCALLRVLIVSYCPHVSPTHVDTVIWSMIAAGFVECLDWNLIVSLFEYYCSSKFFKQRSWWSPAIWKDAFFAAAEIFEKDEALCKWESLESDLSRVWNLGEVDVAIIGAGPGGTLMAYLLAEQHGKSGAQTSLVLNNLNQPFQPNTRLPRKVCPIDPMPSKKWPNNYGVWQVGLQLWRDDRSEGWWVVWKIGEDVKIV